MSKTIVEKAREIARDEYGIYYVMSGRQIKSEGECFMSAMKMAAYMTTRLKSVLDEFMIDTRDKERILTLMKQ